MVNNPDPPVRTEQPVTGLTEAEVKLRHRQGLGNRAAVTTGRTYRQIFQENVFTFINIVLFGLGTA